MIRILLVADHPEHRARLRTVLAAHGDLVVVGEAANGGQALDLVPRLHPDVVLMQALMPIVNGVAATRRIHADDPTIQIVLVAPCFTDTVAAGLRAGALGYLRTDADADEIVQTVRAAHQGRAYHPLRPPTTE